MKVRVRTCFLLWFSAQDVKKAAACSRTTSLRWEAPPPCLATAEPPLHRHLRKRPARVQLPRPETQAPLRSSPLHSPPILESRAAAPNAAWMRLSVPSAWLCLPTLPTLLWPPASPVHAARHRVARGLLLGSCQPRSALSPPSQDLPSPPCTLGPHPTHTRSSPVPGVQGLRFLGSSVQELEQGPTAPGHSLNVQAHQHSQDEGPRPPLPCYSAVSPLAHFVWSPKGTCSWPHWPLEGERRSRHLRGSCPYFGLPSVRRDSALVEKGMRGAASSLTVGPAPPTRHLFQATHHVSRGEGVVPVSSRRVPVGQHPARSPSEASLAIQRPGVRTGSSVWKRWQTPPYRLPVARVRLRRGRVLDRKARCCVLLGKNEAGP